MSSAQFDQEFKSCINSFHVVQDNVKQHFVRCDVCFNYPDIVRRNCDNKKPAPITSEIGIRYRKKYVEEHFRSIYHQKCKDAKLIAESEICERNKNKSIMDTHIKF